MVAEELDHRREIGPPIVGPPFQVNEDGGDAGLDEKRDGILQIFVEIRIENALVHEVGVALDREEHPAQVVQLEHRECVGLAGNGFFDVAHNYSEFSR